MMLGWDDFEISAVGGTGFLNNNNGNYTTFRQRVQADVLNRSPEIIGIFGGINDQGLQTKATLQTEITALVAQCRASVPNALILGGGPWQPRGSLAVNTNYTDVRDAFLASLLTITGPWVFVDPLTGGWTTSAGGTGAASTSWITGEGTAQFRTVTDGVTTSASTTITSATAAFVASDVGFLITGAGIPTGTTIASITNGTTAVLSVAATVTASAVTLNITQQTGTGNGDIYIADGTHPNGVGSIYAANRVASATSAALTSLGP
jgi:lysophospholipase L1-like esterase